MSRTFLQSAMIGCAMAMLCAGAARGATLEWKGITWTVKDSPGSRKGPGPNYWSASTNCVWVDGNGYLHLKVAYLAGKWQCAEIYTEQPFEYGEFRFVVEPGAASLDTNVVAGFFLYNSIARLETLGEPEIDIEFARRFTGMSLPDNTQYGLQPVLDGDGHLIPTNAHAFTTPGGSASTHRFVWTNTHILFESYTGDGEPGSGTVIEQWTRSSNGVSGIPTEAMHMRLHLNCWLFKGAAPGDPQRAEVVIRDIRTPPFVPQNATQTNVLDSFEEDAVTAESLFPLFDFENGVGGWFVFWNAAMAAITNEGGAAHGGTNAALFRYLGGGGVRNWSRRHGMTTTEWTNYTHLSFWARSDSVSAPGVSDSVQIGFLDSYLGRNWYQVNKSVLTNTYQRYTLKLDTSDFGTDTQQWVPPQLHSVTGLVLQTDHNQSSRILMDDIALMIPARTGTPWRVGSWNASYAVVRSQTNAVHDGGKAVELSQSAAGTPVYNCLWTTNLAARDWTPFNKIAYWARRSGTSGDHWARIQFIQGDGDFWSQSGEFLLTTNWTRHEVSFNSGFGWGGDDWTGAADPPYPAPFPTPRQVYDRGMTNVHALRFVLRNPSTGAQDYQIDRIELIYELGEPALSVSVSNKLVSWGGLTASPSQFRFVSTNYAEVHYSVENAAAWQMYVFTTHADRRAGLVGVSDPSKPALPLRVWAGTNDPAFNPQQEWPSLLYVGDEFDSKWPIASSALENPIESGFRLYFVTEAVAAYTQQYAAPVVIELQAE